MTCSILPTAIYTAVTMSSHSCAMFSVGSLARRHALPRFERTLRLAFRMRVLPTSSLLASGSKKRQSVRRPHGAQTNHRTPAIARPLYITPSLHARCRQPWQSSGKATLLSRCHSTFGHHTNADPMVLPFTEAMFQKLQQTSFSTGPLSPTDRAATKSLPNSEETNCNSSAAELSTNADKKASGFILYRDQEFCPAASLPTPPPHVQRHGLPNKNLSHERATTSDRLQEDTSCSDVPTKTHLRTSCHPDHHLQHMHAPKQKQWIVAALNLEG